MEEVGSGKREEGREGCKNNVRERS
jgi:hypothetical protein